MESMNIINKYFKGFALWEVYFTEVPLEWDVLGDYLKRSALLLVGLTFSVAYVVFCAVVMVCVLYPCSNIKFYPAFQVISSVPKSYVLPT